MMVRSIWSASSKRCTEAVDEAAALPFSNPVTVDSDSIYGFMSCGSKSPMWTTLIMEVSSAKSVFGSTLDFRGSVTKE